METPIVKLSEEQLETVYEPSEDSFLLIDALEMDLEAIKSSRPATCLEIGSGSGVIITALAMALRKCHPAQCIAIDINVNACKATKTTAALNNVEVEVLQSDLLNCIRGNQSFDIILFNPPYVVTEDEELEDKSLLSKAWAGGANGRRIMDKLFPRIPEVLADNGTFYLLVIKENDPESILRTFQEMNMIGSVVAERKIRGEHLHVLRFKKAVRKCI